MASGFFLSELQKKQTKDIDYINKSILSVNKYDLFTKTTRSIMAKEAFVKTKEQREER